MLAAYAQPKPSEAEQGLVRIGQPAFTERCPQAQRAIGFYRHKYAAHRQAMNLKGPVPRVWYDCTAARRRAEEWRFRAKQAMFERRSWERTHLLAHTDNWTRAMRTAQRAFPGTLDWLTSISSRECRACYTTTAFVCNYQGSGACGPMQFMSGTFYGYSDDAKDWLDRRGYVTAPETWSWRSQLGQALTAAYMRYTGRDGCHWCL